MVPWNFTGQAGWAQINGRDDIPIPIKVEFDVHYLEHRSLMCDMKILFLTLLKVLRGEGVTH
jgi:O-antigen biosynthesis protein WbqP